MSFTKTFQTVNSILKTQGLELGAPYNYKAPTKSAYISTKFKAADIIGTDVVIVVKYEKVAGMKGDYWTFAFKNGKGFEFGIWDQNSPALRIKNLIKKVDFT